MALRPMPTPEWASPYTSSDALAYVRDYMESLTTSNPYISVDWQSYQTILSWCEREDYRPVIEDVLKRKLALPSPYCDKAIILAQALPHSSIVSLEKLLKPLAEPKEGEPVSMTKGIASQFLAMISETKKAGDAKGEASKWKAWTDLYGKPGGDHSMPPLPKPVEWGNWGLMRFSADEWWPAPKEEES